MSDKAIGVLSKAPQRQVLTMVAEHDGPIDLETLGDETILEARSWGEQEIALYHVHLPRLDDAGFIQWDADERTIEKGEQFDEVRPLLDLVDTDDNGEEFRL